jgi:hypothetical protein
MLGKITGIRRMDRKKGSILKSGAEKKDKKTYPISRFLTSPSARAALAAAITGASVADAAKSRGYSPKGTIAVGALGAALGAGGAGLVTLYDRIIHARALKGRKALKEEASYEKASDDKTAPAEPEMLSQIGTIVKRIRARTDPEGSRELGLASTKEATMTLAVATKPRITVGSGGGPRLSVAAPPKVKSVKKFNPEPGHGLSREEADTISGMMGSGPGGWEKLTAAQALALLKSALLRSV